MSQQAVALHPPPAGRDWATYSLSQTKEGALFDGLLVDLIQAIPDPPIRRGPGRPPIPRSTLLYCVVKKEHTGLPNRRLAGVLEASQEAGYIAQVPRYNGLSDFLCHKGISPVLRRLVQLSAYPLASVEHDFAVDSTGFRFSAGWIYNTQKHHVEPVPPVWEKLHACVGVRSNLIADCLVDHGHSADSPMLRRLLPTVAKTFQIHEVSADKAYSGRENLTLIEKLGGTPYIPFKINAKANSKGSWAWKRAYHHFHLFRDNFDSRYHKRSNVEATFSSLKQRFSERLDSKTETGRRNELYARVVAYNVCQVIRAMHELGVEPHFGP